MKNIYSLLIQIIFFCISQLFLFQNIFADHSPAIPRKVNESKIGPFEVRKTIPQEYSTCKPLSEYSNQYQESYYFKVNINNSNTYISLQINTDCISASEEMTICTPNTARKISYISATTQSISNPFPKSDLVCKLNLSIDKLITSKGIQIGDSLEKVLKIYGPPSINEKLTLKESNTPYYIVYTKEEMTGIGQEFDFLILKNKVIGIRIFNGE